MQHTIQIPSKEIPVAAEADVVVAGGGLSGVIAAVAAARNGANTCLVERFSCLGGVATMGLPIQGYCDAAGEQIVMGLPEEFRRRLAEKGGAPQTFVFCKMHNPFLTVVPEVLKLVCQEMLLEAGVRVLVDTAVTDVVGTGEKLEAVVVEGKSGEQAIRGKFFIDATGDADLVVRAGLPYMQAPSEDLQASTMGFILGGVDKTAIQSCLLKDPDQFDLHPLLPREQIANAEHYIMVGLTNLVKQAQREPTFSSLYGTVNYVTLPQDGLVYVNSVHVSGLNPCDTEELSRMEMEARAQVDTVASFMQRYVPGFEHSYLISTGPWLGVRESRIIEGMECLSKEDILNGKIPGNTIALGGYPYDFHQKDEDIKNVQFHKVPVYGIPYGCLIPRGSTNLLVAGKTICATREAMCSSRVMAQCMAEGQAAGVAAALCCKSDIAAWTLSAEKLCKVLRASGAKLS